MYILTSLNLFCTTHGYVCSAPVTLSGIAAGVSFSISDSRSDFPEKTFSVSHVT